jgi:hypothetical protein
MEVSKYLFIIQLFLLNMIFWGFLWVLDGFDKKGDRFDFWPVIPISIITTLIEWFVFFD